MGAHRGRWQAQGGRVQRSRAWDQNKPLRGRSGQNLLEQLRKDLTSRESKLRAEAFKKASNFVKTAQASGGIDSPYVRSFYVRGDVEQRRVDIEITAGKAFVS